MTRWIHPIANRLIWFLFLLAIVACKNSDQVTQLSTTEFFTQDFNPQTLDILFVAYNGSSMYDNRAMFAAQAKALFTKIDAVPRDYRLGLTTADMDYNKGALLPQGNPTVLTKGSGSLNERTAIFGSNFANVFNIRTGAYDKGFQAALTSLQTSFVPRPAVPLVMIFISDKEDKSGTSVQSYVDQYRAIKGDQADLLKIYSVNYFPLPASGKTRANRCATFDNADIDSAGFEDRYFSLAKLVTPSLGEAVAADLCGNFSANIDFSGLRLKDLTNTFVLKAKPVFNSIQVAVVRQSTGETFNLAWSYDSIKNALVFTTPPPEGTTIQVTYQRSSGS